MVIYFILTTHKLGLIVIPSGEMRLSSFPGYGLTIFPAEVLLVPLADQFRRNFGDDSFSLFFGRYDELARLNGSGMKRFFPPAAPAKEVREEDSDEDVVATLTSSVLEL